MHNPVTTSHNSNIEEEEKKWLVKLAPLMFVYVTNGKNLPHAIFPNPVQVMANSSGFRAN